MPTHHKSPVPLANMVIPVGRCGRKLIFKTESQAKKALEQAQLNRKVNHKLHAEKRYYSCERCGCFHLTGRESWEDKS